MSATYAQPRASTVTVGGLTARIAPDVQPVVTLTAYAPGDLVGAKLKFSAAARNARASGLMQSIILTSASPQTATFDVVLFNGDPSGTTFTDNGAFSVATADLDKIIGVAHCTDITAVGGSVAQALNLALPFSLPAGVDIYAAIVVRGAATFTGVGDLKASMRVLQD